MAGLFVMLKSSFIVRIICTQVKLQLYSTKSNTITINILRFLFKIFHKTLGWVKNVFNYLPVHNIINLEKKTWKDEGIVKYFRYNFNVVLQKTVSCNTNVFAGHKVEFEETTL